MGADIHIDKETVRKMAELSRVNLSESEVVQLEKEFAEILSYFSSIQTLSKEGSKLSYVSESNGESRNDNVGKKNEKEADAIVEQFAQKDGRLMLAPKTL
ncbi:aspartyl/glutamyl-tRNA amidotransferase subunit C [Candidatus Micrarchaeota archaeon]|nr:aspartyl/glutamyl-tRNA amidotransferase subunit C [Candidatus Micrarchaeota archaeon]